MKVVSVGLSVLLALSGWSHAFGPRRPRLLFVPLDERFTTRDLFLAYARLTPYEVITPERGMLSRKKVPPRMDALLAWVEREAPAADAAILSADMLLYGGLIGSRIGRESLGEVRTRLQVLERIRRENPKLRLFVSSTIMRMPAHPSSEEEPEYYARFGRSIFLFSYHSHRFEVLGDPRDREQAEAHRSHIPKEVLDDYLGRRERNFAINRDLIELVKKGVIEWLSITLDDNAEFGLFKKEAAELERLARPVKDRVAIYPGADEAQLPLLSRLVLGGKRVPVHVVYRFPEGRRLVPEFEGHPLEASVAEQVRVAGGVLVDDPRKADVLLYVNNFAERQTFAGAQPVRPREAVEPVEAWLRRSGVKRVGGKILAIADVRYYNGADAELIEAIFASRLRPDRLAYAGWNTSGNTLGSAIALGLLRARMASDRATRDAYKKILWARFLEDWVYMVIGREHLRRDLQQRGLTGFEGTPLEQQYRQRMKDLFDSFAPRINRFLRTRFAVGEVYFPWHRLFEIGFTIVEKG